MKFLGEVLGDDLYSQVESKMLEFNGKEENKDKQIKVENINSGAYVSKDKYLTLQTEVGAYKQQLTNAQTTIKSYNDLDIEGIKKSATEWETKYKEDTEKLNEAIQYQEKEFTAKEYLNNQGFKSKLAKKAALSDFMKQGFKFDNGSFLGAEDYMKKLKESDPESFSTETQDGNQRNWVQGTANTYKPSTSTDEEAYLKQKYSKNKYYKNK